MRIWRKYNTQMVNDKMAKDKMAKDESVQVKDEAVQASPKRKINTGGGSILISQRVRNPAITPCISRALVKLADLTEYNQLGGEPEWDLSIMIERDDVLFLEHEARLHELVDARSAQLRLWLQDHATKLALKHRKHRKEAEDCLRDISEM